MIIAIKNFITLEALMARILKNPEERRNELLDTAEELFIYLKYY